MELALDFDKANLASMDSAVEYLVKRFGKDKIRIRRSSSGEGYHVRVMADVSPDEEREIREELGDCRGRRISDDARTKGGLRTSRLFDVKGTVVMSDDYGSVKSATVKRAKRWKKLDEVRH